jgi:RNA polymerase sigma factor (sigma-70 family)
MTAVPFQTFFDAHSSLVLGFLTSLVGPNEADDCFQETFIAALRAYPRLDRGANLRAWVLAIARNKAIDSHRSKRRRPLPLAEPDEGRRTPAPPDAADPELWAAVRRLPDKQRAAIFLRYVADLPHRDVAAALECSEEAARRNAHEGLKKLQEAYA